MELTDRERARSEAFDLDYQLGLLAPMQAVECAVCGCAYGSTAWTTRDEADTVAAVLELRAGMTLLEVGAGSGWPALYLAGATGCDAVLTDLPPGALRIARDRAVRDGIADRCLPVCANGACLPFRDGRFDVVNHSDVLCCLVEKRTVLRECRRVIRRQGRMVFSVIYVPAGLCPEDHARALATAPEFVESDADYPTLIEETGWKLLDRRDLTGAFTQSCRRRLDLEAERERELRQAMGPAEFDARLDKFRRRIPVLEQGHLRRELFVCAVA